MTKKKILLVDDVGLFIELEKTFFSRQEFDLLVARNGREALDSMRAQRPDLVFLDLHMPEMDGDECCRLVKADPDLRPTPIIMVTQAGREEDLERCRKAGCEDIVLKPINRSQILAAAHRFLNVHDGKDQRYLARLRVQYGSDPGRLLCNYAVNLSTGGLFLETEAPLPEETPLTVDFILPTASRNLRCKARVAWVNGPLTTRNSRLPTGMGLQFLDLTLDQMDAIREYLTGGSLEPYW